MPPDLSKLSDKDLEALASNDISKVSDAGLAILSGETPKKKTKQEQINEALTVPQKSPMSLGSVDDIFRQLGLTARALSLIHI